eukprot:6791489-Pyramimonas_sp.AAC.1
MYGQISEGTMVFWGAEPPKHSMFPLTLRRAKAAIPFGGSYRLIDIALNNIIRSGLKQIYVLTQYNSRSLNAHIYNAYPATSSMKLDASVEVRALHVAMHSVCRRGLYRFECSVFPFRTFTRFVAVTLHVRHIRIMMQTCTLPGNPDEDAVLDILVLSGEHLYNMDYSALIRQHRETGADITISTTGVGHTNKALYGVDGAGLGLIQLNDQYTVERFTEKPNM